MGIQRHNVSETLQKLGLQGVGATRLRRSIDPENFSAGSGGPSGPGRLFKPREGRLRPFRIAYG